MEQQYSPTIELGGGVLDGLIGISEQISLTGGAGGGGNALSSLIAANTSNYQSMINGM